MKVDLLLLEDLHQSTTPGPWYQFGPPWFQDELGVLAGSDDPHVATLVADLTPLEALDDDSGKWAQNPADAQFMVETHRLLPALIAELWAAREVVEATRAIPGDTLCADCYEAACGHPDEDPDDGLCECSCHYRQSAVTEALAAYDQAVTP